MGKGLRTPRTRGKLSGEFKPSAVEGVKPIAEIVGELEELHLGIGGLYQARPDQPRSAGESDHRRQGSAMRLESEDAWSRGWPNAGVHYVRTKRLILDHRILGELILDHRILGEYAEW